MQQRAAERTSSEGYGVQQDRVGDSRAVTAQTRSSFVVAHVGAGTGVRAGAKAGASRFRRWRLAAMAGVYGLSMGLASPAAMAQGIPLIRDAETEKLLKD